jgi:hypothetical protein
MIVSDFRQLLYVLVLKWMQIISIKIEEDLESGTIFVIGVDCYWFMLTIFPR